MSVNQERAYLRDDLVRTNEFPFIKNHKNGKLKALCEIENWQEGFEFKQPEIRDDCQWNLVLFIGKKIYLAYSIDFDFR